MRGCGGAAAALGAFSILGCSDDRVNTPSTTQEQWPISRRPVGETLLKTSILSFGGGSVFMSVPDGEWEGLLDKAVDSGVNYFDTSCDYVAAGEDETSEQRFGEILSSVRNNVIISTKFNAREISGMMREVEASLEDLKTDYIDILYIHSIQEEDTPGVIESVYKRMLDLKDKRIIRYIGFSSMDSSDASRVLIENLEFDVAMLAINPTNYNHFVTNTLPAALSKNVGVIAMKAFRDIVGPYASAQRLFDYALSQQGVASAVIGHGGNSDLDYNIELAESHIGLTADQISTLEKSLKPCAGPHVLSWARPGYVDGVPPG